MIKIKVHVAKGCIDYEGFVILGVFSTNEAAQKCCNDHENDTDKWSYDDYDTEEYEMLL